MAYTVVLCVKGCHGKQNKTCNMLTGTIMMCQIVKLMNSHSGSVGLVKKVFVTFLSEQVTLWLLTVAHAHNSFFVESGTDLAAESKDFLLFLYFPSLPESFTNPRARDWLTSGDFYLIVARLVFIKGRRHLYHERVLIVGDEISPRKRIHCN